jgi:hypothetical protein
MEAGKARGQARPAMSRDPCNCTRPAPRHGKSNPFFTMSKINVCPPRTAGKCCLSRWVAALECRMHSKAWHSQNGGARRDRTDDLLLAKQALSQLSYGPGHRRTRSCPTPCARRHQPRGYHVRSLKVRARDCGWWAWVDSNYRPHAYQACALTRLSYRPDSMCAKAGAPKSNPGRKRNEDGETRQMGRSAPDFSIDASIARHDARLKTHP